MVRGRPKKNKEVQLVPEKESLIKASLKVLGRTYQSKGYTLEEVLRNFKTHDWLRGAGVFTIEKEGEVKEKIIAANHIKNIFGMASGTMREVSLKWIKQLF